MKYISGIHALNLPCSLETCGDWHASGIQWKNLTIRDTDDSVFGSYGLEEYNKVPEHPGTYMIANTLRALLDLIVECNFGLAQGAREDFICNEEYTQEFMEKVYMLRDCDNWEAINMFMISEYKLDWLDFTDQRSKYD